TTLAMPSAAFPFSPCGRRWREAPDEGFSRLAILIVRKEPLTRLASRGTLPHKGGRERAPSIRWQRHLVVDQRIQRRLHIDLGVDDAGLLQCEARGEDRFTLGRADAAVSELG